MLIFKSRLTKDSLYLSELTCIFTSEVSACFLYFKAGVWT